MEQSPNAHITQELVPKQDEEKQRLARSLAYAHERFGIPLNVTEMIDKTLHVHGFAPLDPPLTPSVEQWIAERIVDQGYAGYNHGSFVYDTSGDIGFAKVHYGPDNTLTSVDELGNTHETTVGGPKREALVLSALGSHGYETPHVLGYSPENPEGAPSSEAETFEVLVIEAVLPEYGAVRKRESWTPALARKAAEKIATFGQPIEEIDFFRGEKIPLPVESLIDKLPRSGDEYEQTVIETLTPYAHLDTPIVVHGDTWFNNIIARHDDSDVMFVDWELAGPGYRGQDAGRKLWDLTLKDDWRFAEYGEAADAFTDEWCKTDDDRQSLAFGVIYESLRWISDRLDKLDDPTTDDATRISLIQEIDDVKSHTLAIHQHIIKERSDGAAR